MRPPKQYCPEKAKLKLDSKGTPTIVRRGSRFEVWLVRGDKAIKRVGLLSTLAIGAIALTLAPTASAEPPSVTDPRLAPWFKSLMQPRSDAPCCAIADCRLTDARLQPWGYEARIDGRWISIPADTVLDHVENPTGRAVVCYHISHDETLRPLGISIHCFVRPTES